MTRTTIRKTEANTVTLTGTDPETGEAIKREFWVPPSGGYVREGYGTTSPQVCSGLASRGNTLVANDHDDLLRVIRREWAACRRATAKMLDA